MNKYITLILLLISINTIAQTAADFRAALTTRGRSVQAIHTYPKEIRNGNCHWVPVTSITISGTDITIVETWTNGYGTTSQTVLTGNVKNDIAEGTWSSDFSSGNWSYNFTTNSGRWNKTNSFVGTFIRMELLKFVIVQTEDLRDGEFSCH